MSTDPRKDYLLANARELSMDASQLHDDLDDDRLDLALICAASIAGSIGLMVELLVAEARHEGWTWERIAAPLGVSRQSAWERFRHVDEVPAGPHPSEG